MRNNILANYLGMAIVVLAPILALPWYLSELGIKQFGLVGFIATLNAILGLLDAGMSQALVREVAVRFDVTERGRYRTAELLMGFERIYWLFPLCVGIFVILMAETLERHWLQLEGLPPSAGRDAVYGAVAIFVSQFPGSLYRSLLVGIQKQAALNGILIIGALLRHVGGVIAVINYPTFFAYLAWHTTATLFETLLRRRWAWHMLDVNRSRLSWTTFELRPVWRMVASMSGVTLLGALTVQMDRIILSRMVSLEQFACYTIAATVAVGSLQLINPLSQAMLPRAIQFRSESLRLYKLNLKMTGFICLIVLVGGIAFSSIGKLLLEIWLKSPDIAEVVFPILAVLLVGVALNAFYTVGYVNWLVRQKVGTIFFVNAIALALSVVLTPIFIHRYGTIGAAFGWLAINVIGFMYSLGWLKRNSFERNP